MSDKEITDLKIRIRKLEQVVVFLAESLGLPVDSLSRLLEVNK